MLACILNPDIPQRLMGDPNRIRQVLTNLVNNALKFTSQGYVSACGGNIESQEGQNLIVRIQVEAHGDRDSGRPARPALQELFAGRYLHHAQIWRDGPGPGHRKAAGRADGRRHRHSKRGRQGNHLLVHSQAWNRGRNQTTHKPAVQPEAAHNVRVLAIEKDPAHRQNASEQLTGRFASTKHCCGPRREPSRPCGRPTPKANPALSHSFRMAGLKSSLWSKQ